MTTQPSTTPHAVCHAVVDTRLGELTLVAAHDALIGLYFPQHRHGPAAEDLGARIDAAAHPMLGATATQLEEYLAGERRDFVLELAPRGDDLSRAVWERLRAIPYGGTTTYGALARELGNPHLAQRVGQVVGRNPLSIVVPCHRVVGADGSLTGYAGGLERKRLLLDLEEPATERAARLF